MKSTDLLSALALGMVVCGAASPALAQGARQPLPENVQQPVYRVAKAGEAAEGRKTVPEKYAQHPLAPVLQWAYDGIDNLRAIKDYSATLVKRELVDGEVSEAQFLFIKVRHEPFSVYTHFLAPKDLKGQEAMYVEGSNDGKMWAHASPGSFKYKFGTVSLKPDSKWAMVGNRYPITCTGLLHLTSELIKNGEHDIQYGECDVKIYPDAKINGRVCTCIQVSHPVRRTNFRFHLAQIFVDKELNVPIRYAAYDWPKTEGGEPQLIEEYTYLNLKLNQGFTDDDFDINNKDYLFK